MAVRTTGLGGTQFADGEILYDYDLDDTFNAIKKTRVLDALQSATAYDATNTLTLAKSVDISLNQSANSAYRVLASFTFAGLTGNAQIRLRFVRAGNNTDVTMDCDDGSANATVYVAFEVFPVSTTTVAVFGSLVRNGQADGASSQIASTTTLASSGTWAAQTTLEIYYSGNGGTGARIDALSIQHIAG